MILFSIVLGILAGLLTYICAPYVKTAIYRESMKSAMRPQDWKMLRDVKYIWNEKGLSIVQFSIPYLTDETNLCVGADDKYLIYVRRDMKEGYVKAVDVYERNGREIMSAFGGTATGPLRSFSVVPRTGPCAFTHVLVDWDGDGVYEGNIPVGFPYTGGNK